MPRYERNGIVIDFDEEPSDEELDEAFAAEIGGGQEKGFLDRLGESSNIVKALKSPLESAGALAGSVMPQNLLEAAYAPIAIPTRMMMEGVKSYGEGVADREQRLFNRMNEDPDSRALTAAQMLVAPIPFAGKLVEPLEEDITAGNIPGALGSVGGVALDALGARVAPGAAKAPGQAARAVSKATLKPVGQKLYSHAVAREAAKKSVPHVDNPMPYIRGFNPVVLAQDATRAGQSIANSNRLIQLEKTLGEKLNPDVRGLGKNKPGFSGEFGDARSIDDLIEAEDTSKFRREHELERVMNQERLNYRPSDFENTPGEVIPLENYDPRMFGGTRIPKFTEPEVTPQVGVSALRGKLSQIDPNAINPNALEPSIPKPVDQLWAEQLIEEEAGGRPALAPVDSIDKSPYASQNPRGTQDFTSDQIVAEQNRIARMLNEERPPVIEAPPDAPVITGIREQLIAKGIPESLVDKMTPEQMQAALQRKGTRASGTNPRALRGESSLPKVDFRTNVEAEIIGLGKKLKELRPTANTVKGFRKLDEDAYGKATGKYGEGEAHLDFDRIMSEAESNADSRKLTGDIRRKSIAQDVATKSVDATLHEAAHGPSKGHGADFQARMQDLRESLGRGGYERMVKNLRDKIMQGES